MNIKTTYDVGDTVYLISCGYPVIQCPLCVGKGSFTIQETGQKSNCFKCYGEGKARDYQVDQIWEVLYSTKISHVRILSSARDTFGIEYSLNGGADYWLETYLFPTADAAKAKCDELNGNKN